jgi:predicted ATPase
MYNLGLGTILRGWALAEQGQGEEGIAQMRQGQVALRAMGAKIGQSASLARLADAYGKVGQVEDGLTLLAEALTVVQETGERFWQAELYRLKGTLTLQSQASLEQVQNKSEASQDRSENPSPKPLIPNPKAEVEQEAEEYFFKAIEIARKQQAKSLELRATTSLARLWQQQGKYTEAHEMLSEIYNWFTEGFDTKDLREAKALIEELSH